MAPTGRSPNSAPPDSSPVSVPCPHIADCTLRPIWEHLESAVTDTLKQITLADLVQKERHIRDRVAAIRAV